MQEKKKTQGRQGRPKMNCFSIYYAVKKKKNKTLIENTQFEWTEKCEESLNILKHALCSAPILAFPDMNRPFILTCDASCSGLGYILGQLDESGRERVIEYSGRALHAAEKNYSVSELEYLTIVSGIKQFSSYLSTDIPFTIITDHQALKVLNSITTCQNGRIARWALYLQGFRYTVQYRKGELNNADALSRLINNSEFVNNVCCQHPAQGKSAFSFDNCTESDDESDESLSENQKEKDSEPRCVEVINRTASRQFLEVCFEYDQPKTVFNLDTDSDSSSKQIDNTSKLIELQKTCADFNKT